MLIDETSPADVLSQSEDDLLQVDLRCLSSLRLSTCHLQPLRCGVSGFPTLHIVPGFGHPNPGIQSLAGSLLAIQATVTHRRNA